MPGRDIRLELRRGRAAVTIHWPLQAASEARCLGAGLAAMRRQRPARSESLRRSRAEGTKLAQLRSCERTDRAVTAHVPITFRKRGGRKLVVTPDGAPWAPRPRVDNAMVKALARAFRWRKMLDEGVHATLEDLARAKGVAPSYVSRVLRLTLLAPEIVEAILDGRQPAELQLDDLLKGFPLEWERQQRDWKADTDWPAASQSAPASSGSNSHRVSFECAILSWGRAGVPPEVTPTAFNPLVLKEIKDGGQVLQL